MTSIAHRLKDPLVIWIACGLAILYGSLIPFDFTPHLAHEAIARFRDIPLLSLGPAQRADWVANLLIYIPWAYIGMTAFVPRLKTLRAATFVIAFCVGSAIGIEFLQIYFPPRTVSLNDLFAETLGTLLGVGVWVTVHQRLEQLTERIKWHGRFAGLAALLLYLIVYLLIALFPFDFILSPTELANKIQLTKTITWGVGSCGDPARCMAKLLGEIVASVPIGMLIAHRIAPSRRTITLVVMIGFVFGLAIEGAQLLLVSGLVQGSSILTRALGAGIGAWLLDLLRRGGIDYTLDPMRILARLRRVSFVLSIPFFVLLYLVIEIPQDNTPLSLAEAWRRLGDIHFIPFYYHYFSTETNAVSSFLSNFLIYALAGVFIWLWAMPKAEQKGLSSTIAPSAFAGLILAASAEFVRLFSPELRPDPTNILIGIVAGASGALFCNWLWRLLKEFTAADQIPIRNHHSSPTGDVDFGRRPTQASQSFARSISGNPREGLPAVSYHDASSIPPEKSTVSRIHRDLNRAGDSVAPTSQVTSRSTIQSGLWQRMIYRVIAIASILIAVYLGMSLPGVGPWVTLSVVLYVAILWRFPNIWLLVLPIVLVVFNFAPWTGRFFFDESDVFVMATLSVFFWRDAFNKASARMDALKIAMTLLSFGYGISLLLALWPLPPVDANAFSNYYSPYNSVRVAKSLFWALMLWPALHAARARGADVQSLFSHGLLIALTGLALVVGWERLAFTGLLNFSNDYRVTGSFASMHTGGAFIDGFLALSIPLIAVLFRWRSRWLILVLPLAAISLYVALVTYSRGTYAAVAVSGAILLGFAVFGRRQRFRVMSAVSVLLLLSAAALGVTAVLKGHYMSSRFETVERDMETRLRHWRETITQMDPGLTTVLFGMGPGRFPVSYFWRNREGIVPATYRFKEDNGHPYLSTNLGSSMYLDQRIAFDPYQSYVLTIRYRSDNPKLRVTIALCEKSLLYSYHCGWYSMIGKEQAGWRLASRTVTPGSIAQPWALERPRALSVVLSGKPTIMDVSLVSLRDASGRELVQNGDFSAGMDDWFFSTDNHLPWHIKNLLVSRYFDTGLVGTTGFLLLMLVVLVRLIRQARQGDLFAFAFLASFAAIMTVGLFDSPFDDPRLGLLLWLFFLVSADSRFMPSASTKWHRQYKS